MCRQNTCINHSTGQGISDGPTFIDINQLVPLLVKEIKPITTQQMAPVLAGSITTLVADELKELLPPVRAAGRADTVEARLHRDFASYCGYNICRFIYSSETYLLHSAL